MQGNFTYNNPTKLYFGEDAIGHLTEELNNYGPTVMLSYGGGSIKRNGIYDAVAAALREAGTPTRRCWRAAAGCATTRWTSSSPSAADPPSTTPRR